MAAPPSAAIVAGRDSLLVQALSALLAQRGWKTQASTLTDALAACRKVRPAVLLFDIAAIEDAKTVKAVRDALPKARIAACLGERNLYLVRELRAAGADILLHRSAAPADVDRAFEALRKGGVYVCPQLPREAAGRPRRFLSPRETEVLRLLGYGNTNKQVAELLQISEKTVEAHRANIKRKLGARGLSDLVRYAISAGLVDTRDALGD